MGAVCHNQFLPGGGAGGRWSRVADACVPVSSFSQVAASTGHPPGGLNSGTKCLGGGGGGGGGGMIACPLVGTPRGTCALLRTGQGTLFSEAGHSSSGWPKVR